FTETRPMVKTAAANIEKSLCKLGADLTYPPGTVT
ncbi:unnamed protein product, partial [marine sediment metagenome]